MVIPRIECVLDWHDVFNNNVRMLDCSDLPLELVARNTDWARLEIPTKVLLHPDLWHDGAWLS